MKIGAVAKNAGIRPSAIRFYERVGVLPQASRKGGQRPQRSVNRPKREAR